MDVTDQKCKMRRQKLVQTLGLNMSKRYMEVFKRRVTQSLDKIEVSKEIDYTHFTKQVFLEVFSEILFGPRILEYKKELEFLDVSGKAIKANLIDFYTLASEEALATGYHPSNLMFPELADYKLSQRGKSWMENIATFHRELELYVDEN